MTKSKKLTSRTVKDSSKARLDQAKEGKVPGIGHNFGGQAGEMVRSVVERVERLEEERAGISADIRDVFAEAKGNGLDVKELRAIIRERKYSAQERAEKEAIRDAYRHALGMLGLSVTDED